MKKQSELKNEDIWSYSFLEDMYVDDFYPNHLVDKCRDILIELCFDIERTHPKDLDELYALTHAATDKFNHMHDEFYENNSEIETTARDCISIDFTFIATSYGFADADSEELIATRDW
ncbi:MULTISPECIES: DUF5713 family protein [Niastella]|uniref:Uncharacterized protein n=1 Tax=Niastella soli TaxID=2821487 RepID=A0ABS3YWY4_9BACT|nr:DUF5713 family protein [Niastella soli]MBO9202017.1 hypothetical protein [Niastella soli]